MDFLPHLWLPILLSAAAVWFAAAIAWMALPHHKRDFIAVPDEDAFIEALKKLNLPPGNYQFPDFKTSAKLKDPKVQDLLNNGPVGQLNLWKPPLGMAANLVLTFLVYLVAGVVIAYLAWQTLPHGPGAVPPTFARVFQITGTSGLLTYCFAFIPNSLWFGAKRSAILMNILDGIAYALVTAAIFASLWPK